MIRFPSTAVICADKFVIDLNAYLLHKLLITFYFRVSDGVESRGDNWK